MLELKSKTQGAEITSIKYKGVERMHDGVNFWNRQAPVLFPIVGQLKEVNMDLQEIWSLKK